MVEPWPSHVVETEGGYRNEMFLEKHIGGPLYENQENMRHLLVPSINNTVQRFVPTALSLAKTTEEKVRLREACAAFPEEAKELQKRLIARRNGDFANSKWLQKWWNQVRVAAKYFSSPRVSFIPAHHHLFYLIFILFSSFWWLGN